MEKVAVIMAGGSGSRFWPMSRREKPKQFLELSGKDTLLNETIGRISKVIDIDNIYIIGNKLHKKILENTLPSSFNLDNILYEPMAKNTAPAIAVSAKYIKDQKGDCIISVFPADHHMDEDEFVDHLKLGMEYLEKNENILTFGIKPTFPSTGYGYIKYHANKELLSQKVDKFVEKPDYQTAMKYLEMKNYLWNSGMFLFRASTIIEEFQSHMPDLYDILINNEIKQENLQNFYNSFPSISFDYGILEKSQNVYVIPYYGQWSDLGSWDSLDTVSELDQNRNIVDGNTLLMDTENSILMGNSKKIVSIGLKDIVFIETDDAILICDKNKSQKIKDAVNILKDIDPELV
ncbi:MAG: mannose-1-phosphate guanylyltransferase [Firmicutes bacterium]|jgi:mannose-1-phosphate guanylyltransferase|nr:mannose-1-phosphate guanylyltransferase [Bacillota bacterium]